MRRRPRVLLAAAGTAATALAAQAPIQAGGATRAMASSTVTPGTAATCTVNPALAKREMRGMWIASVVNIDWPSRQGLTATQQRAELVSMLDLAKANRMNTIVLQVRPTADTFWPSTLEPWSQWITGTQGKAPGWDPLGTAVTEAHARGLELHAWVNPYRVSMDATGKNLVATHPARVHPEWTVSYGGKLYYNPGIPAVRAHVVGVVKEIVAKYDVDAIHFDDYFYPYPVSGQTFNDAATFQAYGAGQTLAQWRRANITALIDDVRMTVRATRPGTQFGVSPFGVWRNVATDATGSNTKAGVQAYDDLYANTRGWVVNGQVDYLAPQDYWSTVLPAAPYGAVAGWWADMAGRSARSNVYLGEAAYRVSATSSETAWQKTREVVSHFPITDRLNASRPAALPAGGVIKGRMFFSAADIRANRLDAMGTVVRERYSRPAMTPPAPWLDAVAPQAPRVARRGRVLSINPPGDALHYVIYRVPKSAANVRPCDLADARNVVAIVPRTTWTWVDPQVTTDLGKYTWLVSAVDEQSNESPAWIAR